ncbi:MAG TPA: ABC transporter permease subunit [Polyangiales bacterium]|nr:ABC transporter permease subunit [Polyangiales bacterium]
MKALVIARREIESYFLSPVAYVVTVVWLVWCGLQFYLLAGVFASAPSLSASANPLSAFFGGSVLFFIPLLVFAPVLTMRLLAEERHTGTLEPLLTAPITPADVVFGKYLAALLFWVCLWLPTGMYVWITSQFGRIDLGAVLASYLGVFGIGLYYMAIGLAMSALAKNQIVAALLTFMLLSGLFAVGLLGFVDTLSEQRDVIDYISLWGHMQAFSKGIVDTRFLVFDVTVAGLFVYLAWRALDDRRQS